VKTFACILGHFDGKAYTLKVQLVRLSRAVRKKLTAMVFRNRDNLVQHRCVVRTKFELNHIVSFHQE